MAPAYRAFGYDRSRDSDLADRIREVRRDGQGASTRDDTQLFVFDVEGAFYVVSFYDDAEGNPHRYGVNRGYVLTRTIP